MNISKCKKKVMWTLKHFPHTRDSDAELLAVVWRKELEALHENTEQTSVKHFFELLTAGRLTSYESASRARRQIQERYTELRGKRYCDRQAAQTQTRLDLGYSH